MVRFLILLVLTMIGLAAAAAMARLLFGRRRPSTAIAESDSPVSGIGSDAGHGAGQDSP